MYTEKTTRKGDSWYRYYCRICRSMLAQERIIDGVYELDLSGMKHAHVLDHFILPAEMTGECTTCNNSITQELHCK